jgi:hypothetical protein
MIEAFEVRASRQSSRKFAAIRLEHNSVETFELNRPQISTAGLPDHAQCERHMDRSLQRSRRGGRQAINNAAVWALRMLVEPKKTAPWRTRAPVSTTDKERKSVGRAYLETRPAEVRYCCRTAKWGELPATRVYHHCEHGQGPEGASRL